MAPFSNLLAALADVPDPPAGARPERYPLPYLLMFTVLALLSRAGSTVASSPSWSSREHLNHHFGVDLKRAPVVNTLRTVLQSLPTEALEEAFRRHAKTLLPAGRGGQTAGYRARWQDPARQLRPLQRPERRRP
ncbi:MAG: transposase family protein [Rhodospirillales bacterium]